MCACLRTITANNNKCVNSMLAQVIECFFLSLKGFKLWRAGAAEHCATLPQNPTDIASAQRLNRAAHQSGVTLTHAVHFKPFIVASPHHCPNRSVNPRCVPATGQYCYVFHPCLPFATKRLL